ncbi:MAG: stage V sporulation protein T [Tyzzerella sp.]|uniref:Stage V sporulation protein T n=1 Tax=Candidatus Fimicola merdigallinarum TaxID=2840819 RepID=A0A9D9DVQ4_9FIRM|nr:stage V sporulation protein T [Candidatus Fimicola merdigallinarum]
MKATGIVRRIDDLGRVVIPKEIRRTLRIREGDPLEIFTDREGEVILKKYSPVGELGTFAKEYADSLSQTVGHITCIVDRDHIVAVSGGSKKDFYDKNISADLENCINKRNTVIAKRSDSNFVPVLEDDLEDVYNTQLISPIISEGDVMGALLFLANDKTMGEVEGKLAQTAVSFLGKQMEQ